MRYVPVLPIMSSVPPSSRTREDVTIEPGTPASRRLWRPPLPNRTPEPPPRRPSGWFGVARTARTRILASYVVLLTLSAVLSIVAIRQILLIRLDDRIQDAGRQEVAELERLIGGRDPATTRPFTHPRRLFDVYLSRNVPSSEEAFLTFVDGKFHRQLLEAFPIDVLPREVLADWAALSSNLPGKGERVTGTFETELGDAHYRVRRVVLGDHTGAFVVAILPSAELDEIEDLQTYGVAVTLVVLLIASAFAYLIAGRALAPVRSLTETAKSISESDLTRRIAVYGAGDAAEMAHSFNAMLDRLEAVFRGQRAFVQDASHELRDPLTICRGHLELLSDDPEEQQRTVALVLGELDRMARIVDDLQLLADAEQPDFLELVPIDLALFTHELFEKSTALASRRWLLDAAGEGVILADGDRLTEAVMNLAHNAVQHTAADETVAIGTSLSDDEARLWVRDNGRGVTVSDQARIFDRFTRGRDAHRRYRGGGLGLAIVQKIAEAHGGHIELDSRLGEGATFTIVVPREAVERGDDVENPDRRG